MFPIKDSVRSEKWPVVTIILIGLNGLAFLYELSLGPHLQEFIKARALIPFRFTALIREGYFGVAFLQVLTSMFLHGGWFHLIGNMWFLWIFGDNVEDRMGHFRFIIFYLLCGIISSLVQIATAPQSMIPNVGASGAIAGALAAYMIFFPRSRVYTVIFLFFFIEIIQLPAFIFLGIWFLMQLVSGVGSLGAATVNQTGGIAWFAHIGGFAAGFILGPIMGYRSRKKRRRIYQDEYFPW